MKWLAGLVFLSCVLVVADASPHRQASICKGTARQGSLKNGWKLPPTGPNFQAYSTLGVGLGRTYVHHKVHAVVLRAYAILGRTAPRRRFVYGETGLEDGGRFRPHKTHQNGLSVDFFVPVVDANGKSVPLPTGVLNKFGYNIEFDDNAAYAGLHIDFDAMAKHLLAIKDAADSLGVGINVVIFDNDYQKLLMQSPSGRGLRNAMTFSTKKPWVRHDEHYHIDFNVPCE